MIATECTASKKRRGPGEGSICQRKSDGRWLASVVIGRDASGKRKRKVVYGWTEDEVKSKLALLNREPAINLKLRLRDYEHARLRKYGISVAEYNLLLEKQGFVCAKCHSPNPKTRNGQFVVDHDHKTGKIRGLLCQPCNCGIGLLGDSIEGILEAVTYLRNHG